MLHDKLIVVGTIEPKLNCAIRLYIGLDFELTHCNDTDGSDPMRFL